jgi:hypothetical protein
LAIGDDVTALGPTGLGDCLLHAIARARAQRTTEIGRYCLFIYKVSSSKGRAAEVLLGGWPEIIAGKSCLGKRIERDFR